MITLARAGLALALALLLALAVPSSAAPPARSFLPAVLAQGAPAWVTLTESDTTFVSVDRDPSTGRIYVSYIDRGNGNHAHLTELIGDRLVELADPVPSPAAAPAFSPDSPKDADAAVLVVNGAVWWFVSSRDPQEPTGPFRLKLLRLRPSP
jgi:hypothetical protein